MPPQHHLCHLSASPTPLRKPFPNTPTILIIGAGNGRLRAQRQTSYISGALWELPPSQCGGVRVIWALENFAIYRDLAYKNPETARKSGVRMAMCTVFHTYRANGGLKDGYEHFAPVIDTDVAMVFWMDLVKSKGAILQSHLRDFYHADEIVNATGRLARETASDNSVYPLRGALLRVVNDRSSFPKITSLFIVSVEADEDGEYRDIAFIVPRNDSILVLGSIVQAHEYDLDLTLNSPKIEEMRKRCEDLLPVLKNAKLDPTNPLVQG
ncbi:hypothetical protein BJX99DRAFT_246986 [Aspergillus californicus]